MTETRRGGRRRRVRGRLPDLRHRLRGRHRLHPPRRLRDHRPRRRDAVATTGPTGLRTLHGFYSHGFPNCFFLGFTQNALTPNFTAHAGRAGRATSPTWSQADGCGRRSVIEPTRGGARRAGCRPIVDTRAAEPRVPPGLHARLLQRRRPGGWRGRAVRRALRAGPVEFFELIRDWRESEMEGLEFR